MKNVEHLFQYGFHDTEIFSIDHEGRQIVLNFNNGIYLLDGNGRETILSKPMQIALKISDIFQSVEEALEIRKIGKNITYLEFSILKKLLQKHTFEIAMLYWSKFNNSILLEGGFGKNLILFSIEGIDDVIVREIKNNVN